MADPSFLDVTVGNDSPATRAPMSYTVRDAQLAVVHEGTIGTGPVELPPGLYAVEMLAPGGAAVTSLVQLEPGQTTNVADVGAPEAETTPATDPPPSQPRTRGPSRGIGVRSPDVLAARLIETELCTSEQLTDGSWQFLPERELDKVPTALFNLGPRTIRMSLPLNPIGGSARLSGCRVTSVVEGSRHLLRMSFAEGRELCVTMDGLLRHNTASAAADLFDGASDLLLGKYSDPPGAALGGLTLHRLGRVGERREWIENLANDFDWLPDGKILCAALLMKESDPGERQRGLTMLLSTAGKRPMYTDGLSLELELLRRWPDDDRHSERTEQLTLLAPYSAYADWDSINLSVDTTG